MRGFVCLFVCMLFLYAGSTAQELPVGIAIRFAGSNLQLQQDYRLGKDTVRFEKIRFYLSNIQLLHKGKVVANDPVAVHLISLDDSSSLFWSIPLAAGVHYDEVSMIIGTDSLRNVSGANEGPLDPIHGMYWSWQSGYINIKIEGYSPSCPSRKHKFQYHLGGYNGSTASQQTWTGKAEPGKTIHFSISIDKWLGGIALNQQYEIMSPSEAAAQLSAAFAKAIVLEP
jgi:hypothetical protein